MLWNEMSAADTTKRVFDLYNFNFNAELVRSTGIAKRLGFHLLPSLLGHWLLIAIDAFR